MTFDDLDDLLSAPGVDLGATEWIDVGPGAAADFARATGLRSDGAGLAPYHVLSLTNRLLPELIQVPAASSGVNYGAECVRFGPPVEIGMRVRARAALVEAREAPGGIQTTIEITVESEGAAEPACVVRSVSRWLR